MTSESGGFWKKSIFAQAIDNLCFVCIISTELNTLSRVAEGPAL